jgi:carboxymethylenebutenolidase
MRRWGGSVTVLAPDLYDGKLTTTVDSARKYIMAALQTNRKASIIKRAVTYAGADANIYSVGWCFGGMMSLQTALPAGHQAKGCVMYYGTPEKDLEKLKTLQCDVLGIFGTNDTSIPNAVVDDFANNKSILGKPFTPQRYAAPHAFANPRNPAYNPQFRCDAFAKAVAFLKSRL